MGASVTHVSSTRLPRSGGGIAADAVIALFKIRGRQ
jgi:hypothetical protein